MRMVLLLCPETLEINDGYGKHSQPEKHLRLLDAKHMLPGLWAHQLHLQPLSLLLGVSLSVFKASSDMVLLCNLGAGRCEKSQGSIKSYARVLCRIQAQALACGPWLSYAAAMLGPCLSLILCSSAQSCTLPLLTELPSCSLDLPCPHRLAWRSLDCHQPWLPSLSLLPHLAGVLPGPLGAATGPAALLAPTAQPSLLPDMACSSRSSSLNSFLPQEWPRLRSSASSVKAEQAALRDRSLSFLWCSSWTGNLVELLEGKFSQQLWTV